MFVPPVIDVGNPAATIILSPVSAIWNSLATFLASSMISSVLLK